MNKCRRARGVISRELSMQNGFGPWDRILYSAKTGYFLSGAYGATKNISNEEGRLYMRGMASPSYWP